MVAAAAAQPTAAAGPSLKCDVIRNITPSWGIIVMGTGSVALSIAGVPWHFKAQNELALAVWCLTAFLFIAVTATLLLRLLLLPSSIGQLLSNPQQPLFLGTFPMSLNTLGNGVVFLLLHRTSPAAVTAAEALFWLNLPAVLAFTLVAPYKLATLQSNQLTLPTMTATWLMPALPALVAANSAAVVARVSLHQAPALIVVGMCLLGVGFLLSYQISTIYYKRLMCHSLPPKELIVSCFLAVAPMSMTAWALLNHAAAAQARLPALQAAAMGGDAAASKLLVLAAALLLWGFAVWWLVQAVACVASCVRQGIPFNLGWWGSVFPVGVFTGSTLAIGHSMDSDAFRGIGTAAVVLHVLLWLFVTVATFRAYYTGHLFHPPALETPKRPQEAAAVAEDAAGAVRQPQEVVNVEQLPLGVLGGSMITSQVHRRSRSADMAGMCDDTWFQRCTVVEQQLLSTDPAGSGRIRAGQGDVENALA